MEKITGGYQLWARSTLDSPIFVDKPSDWFKVWFYLVMKVHWSEDKKLPRGSIYTKREWIKDATNVSLDSIKHFIGWAKGTRMLATQKATHGMIISIVNYAKYQDPESYSGHTESHRSATQKPHRSHNILKKDKKDKKENLSKDKETSVSEPQEVMNQDIDRSFPRKHLYGDETLNWFLDYWSFKMPNPILEEEKWARIFVRNLKLKVGAGKLKEILNWVSDPDCWWYSRLTGFKMLYYKRQQIIQQMNEKPTSNNLDLTNVI